MKYSDYFEINKNYYPEINPDSVKDPENKWQYTFPHKTFIELMEMTERMLSRETGKDKHGIWVEGSYGTGKSRAIWTLQNLLSCSKEDLIQYFANFEALRKKQDLRDKLLSHKDGQLVITSRYGSGEITTIKQFIMAVYDSVTKALKSQKGIDYKGQKTLRGRIATWIEDETHKQIFELLIKKPEYRGIGCFSGKSADDILQQLKNTNANADELLNNIFVLSEQEGINMFDIDMDDLKEWLTDVIDTNNLKAIILFWDEFSSFFKNNKTSLDIFQKLAELAESKPFYMVIVTHMSGSLSSATEQGAFKIVYDRFNHNTIEMPDNIAFELIHDAMKIKEVAKAEYIGLTEELNSYMTDSRKAVCKMTNISEEVMKGIFPFHPMAALMLKYISNQFASNQRSMFNFIKNDDSDNLQAFQWFINNHSPEESQILTIDYLWNFFYEKGTDENSSGIGRSNLDIAVATILDTYPNNIEKLGNNEEKRVLKTVLMMQAISKKTNNGIELFRPTDKNIQYAFEGDDSMENNRAINIIKNILVKNKILYIDSNGSTNEYAAAAVAGDQSQIDSIKERLKKDTKTNALLADATMNNIISFPAAINIRYIFINVTVDNFTVSINRIVNEIKNYQFHAVICFARDEEEEKKIHSLIQEAINNAIYNDIIFIDTSSSIMGLERYERFIDVAAQEEYWRPKDSNLADEKQGDKKKVLNEWKNIIESGNFDVYKTKEIHIFCGSTQILDNTLGALVLKKYPLSFDNAKVSNNLFTEDKYGLGAKNGLYASFGGVYQEKDIRAMLGDAISQNNYWEVKKHEPISKLKIKVDKLINDKLNNDARISISEIFDYLMEEGFMPCNLYAYLTGFLLKEYAGDPYRYSVGETGEAGGMMTSDKLAEFIGGCIKQKHTPNRNYKEKYIEIMTKEQKAFVDFVHEAFSVSENLSVEQTVSKMRLKLKEIGYPVWCFKTIDTNALDDVIDKLAEVANTKEGGNIPTSAGELGKLFIQIPTSSKNLKELITNENGSKAMREFLSSFEKGEILDLAKKIGIQDVMADVKHQIGSGDASWLWDKETGVTELKNLLVEYKIIKISNDTGIIAKTTTFFSCMQAWKEYAGFLKIPYAVLKTKITELATFLECLKDIAVEGDLLHEKHALFLSELMQKSTNIIHLKDKKMDVFKEEYSLYINGFSDKEIMKLCSKLPNSSFIDDKATFEKNISSYSEEIKSEQERFQLLELWDDLSDSKTPYEWSDKHKTPIRVLVPMNEQENAVKLFNTINYQSASSTDVKESLEYLKQKPAYLNDLQNNERINEAFKGLIIQRYAVVLENVDEVRAHLIKAIPTSCYEWYGNPSVNSEIKKLARYKYLNGGNQKVMKKIDVMSSDQAKNYLKSLVSEDVDVGVSMILKEGE